MMTEALPTEDMYVLRYQRNDGVSEAIGRGTTAENASSRYLSQLRASGVDITGYTLVNARPLKRLGQGARRN